MHVSEVWRHPVKSLQGERVDEAVVENSGLAGDRRWGVVDCDTGKVLTGRREPSLLLASARLAVPGRDVGDGPLIESEDLRSCGD
jgi:MOSC domain-containing protein